MASNRSGRLFFAYQYFTSEKFVNPETSRASHIGMSVEQESSAPANRPERGLVPALAAYAYT